MRRVVVTGMGIVSSIGNNQHEVLKSLRDGTSGISFVQEYADLGFRCHVHGSPKVDPFEVLDRRTTRFMGKGAAWNYLAMQEAIKDSGLEEKDIRNPMTGLVMGSGGPSTRTIVEAALITKEKGPRRIGPLAVPKAMSSTASATLATPFGILGLNYSITSACATSSHCTGNGYEQIQMGKQNIVFVGGHEDLDWTLSDLFDAMGAMSTDFNASPTRASRAYDKDRDGFVIAGGAGVLVLEELEHAKARGAKIYAEIVGYGATSDGHDMVAPSGEGALRCMQNALREAKTAGIQTIDYINTHGTSTPVGDVAEMDAINKIFGNAMPWVSSTKSLTGHSLGAAGVHEAIYSILMLQNDFVVGSANVENLDPAFLGMNIVTQNVNDVTIDVVLSNSFGFGGTNASLVFSRFAR